MRRRDVGPVFSVARHMPGRMLTARLKVFRRPSTEFFSASSHFGEACSSTGPPTEPKSTASLASHAARVLSGKCDWCSSHAAPPAEQERRRAVTSFARGSVHHVVPTLPTEAVTVHTHTVSRPPPDPHRSWETYRVDRGLEHVIEETLRRN